MNQTIIKIMKINSKKIFLFFQFTLLMVFSVTSSLFSQTTTAPAEKPYTESTTFFILGALLFGLAVLFATIMIFDVKERDVQAIKAEKIRKIILSDEQLLLDHEYDGIRELDNKLPSWYMFLFYITILFAIVYMINYHVLGKQNKMFDEYTQEMTEAQMIKEELLKSGALINVNNVTVLSDAEDLKKGKEIFTVNCIQCHGAGGEGTVGPNLTDDFWVHGGGIKNVFNVISEGVPAKGMITWKLQLNPKQIQQVASYVLTFKGTNPPNGKAPEGTIWIDSTATDKKIKSDSGSVKQDSVKKK